MPLVAVKPTVYCLLTTTRSSSTTRSNIITTCCTKLLCVAVHARTSRMALHNSLSRPHVRPTEPRPDAASGVASDLGVAIHVRPVHGPKISCPARPGPVLRKNEPTTLFLAKFSRPKTFPVRK